MELRDVVIAELERLERETDEFYLPKRAQGVIADAILDLPELVEMQRVKKLVDQAVANALNGSDERVQLNKGA